MKKWIFAVMMMLGLQQAIAQDYTEAARAWLALVDSGNYGGSWQAAAPMFKQAVTEDKWEAAVTAARKPLGALKSRNFSGAKAASELPGAPDGSYQVLTFNASFENKKNAVETITLMDVEGNWLVVGYFIR
ncbi:DUF4019 domain-containing protein [Biformimicrobium ophioploci]|uniref:DUF4019 domain-containing protein n=1 Tax=Biformimicrobium ophioploci TaxID=3036711 RepID=A0ABQ6M0Y1_9GAMM|nr:DUF4019 domain-containing protein [Microbulbifer sp. NKW57]GMG88014.1 hypothetical protein MNKW57_23350 [Microbulbifer sp. NKW57]